MVGGYFLKVINILRLSEVYLDSAFQFRGHFRITCRTFLHFTIPSPPSFQPPLLFLPLLHRFLSSCLCFPPRLSGPSRGPWWGRETGVGGPVSAAPLLRPGEGSCSPTHWAVRPPHHAPPQMEKEA